MGKPGAFQTVNVRGKAIGRWFPGSKLFVKNVRASKHLFQKTNSWGIDQDVLAELGNRGCRRIHVYDEESGIRYEVDFKNFMEDSHSIDLGHGAQRFLNLLEWEHKLPAPRRQE